MAEKQLVEVPPCAEHPLPRKLCGGMKPYPKRSMLLEPLFPDLRNMWYHEHHAMIDFTAYLPLPATPGFATDGRRILIVAGGNEFNRAPKYLLDMYRPYFSFDEVIIFDAHALEVPAIFNTTESRVAFRQASLHVATRDESDLIYMLPSLAALMASRMILCVEEKARRCASINCLRNTGFKRVLPEPGERG